MTYIILLLLLATSLFVDEALDYDPTTVQKPESFKNKLMYRVHNWLYDEKPDKTATPGTLTANVKGSGA